MKSQVDSSHTTRAKAPWEAAGDAPEASSCVEVKSPVLSLS